MNIGIISDTHGLLRPEAVDALRGSELIIHAGDIGAFEVLDALRELAPLVAIRGNNDTAAWAQPIPEQCSFDVGQHQIHLLHDLKTLAIDLHQPPIAAVISGHSHKPKVRSEEHTSELQSLMRSSYDVFCLKKKNKQQQQSRQQ